MINELEALARAATPGEWERRKWFGNDWPEKRISVSSGNTAIVISPRYAEAQAEHDANYIAAANPATMLKLIEVIRAQHAVLKELEEIYGFEWRAECTARAVLAKANEVMGGE
jgi:hypothetical protein